jgi:hypothetical protein
MRKIFSKSLKFEIIIFSVLVLSFSLIFYLYHSVKVKYCYTGNGKFITKIQKYLFSDWSVVSSTGKNYKNVDGFSGSEKGSVFVYISNLNKSGTIEFDLYKFSTTTFQGLYVHGAENINYDKLNSRKLWMYCVDTKNNKQFFSVG